jgi:hypothetical protein
MCQFFSCVITKPKKVFYSEVSDSHEDIIKANNLDDSENGKLRELFCRIEVLPPNGDVFADFSLWKLRVDEQEKPTWFTNKHEDACMIVAKKVIDKFVLIDKTVQEIKEGKYYLKNSTVEYMSGSSTVKYMSGSSTVKFMYDSSTVESMYGSSTVEYMSGSSTVKYMSGSSTVKSMSESSTVKFMYDSSTVEYMSGSSIAIDRVNGIIYKPKDKKYRQKNIKRSEVK